MTDTEVKIIKAELSQMAAKDKFSNICESSLRLINLYEAIILGNQMKISELEKENEDLKSQIKSFENDFDYQNKVIDKYKEDLKKLRVAYIQAQVANVISGTDFESILKNILNGEFEK